MLRNLTKGILCTLFFMLAATSANAQLYIENGKVELSITPNQTISDKVVVHNTSNKPMTVIAYWEDFEYVEPFNGSKKFYPSGTILNANSRWTSISPSEFTIPAFGKREVTYLMNVPENVSGGYYGVLFIENSSKQAVSSRAGMNIITRVGCLFFTETKDKIKQASLANLSAEGKIVRGDFSNKGNVILIPDGVYYLMDQEGLVIDRGSMDKVYLPPNKSAPMSVTLDSKIPSGAYTLVLTLDLGEGDVLVKEIDVVKNTGADYRITNVRD